LFEPDVTIKVSHQKKETVLSWVLAFIPFAAHLTPYNHSTE